MKKAQSKTILISIMTFVVLSLFVYAASQSVTNNFPVSEWDTSSDNSIDINFTPESTSLTIDWCAIYVNNTGTMVLKVNYTDIFNNTPHVSGVPINDSHAALVLGWNATCYNGSTTFGSATSAFGVDGNTPSVTINNPLSGVGLRNLNTTLFQYTPIDTSNPSNCWFYINFSGTFAINQTNVSYKSGTQISVNLSTNAGNHTARSIADGNYIWNAVCNDTAGNRAWAGENRTFLLDTVDPTYAGITIPFRNNTYDNDTTPSISWNQTTELNFNKYVIELSTLANMSNPIQSIEITNRTLNRTTLANIENDGTYFIRVQSHDDVGRISNSTVIRYNLDSVAPIVTLNAPINNSFISDIRPDFNATVVDVNPDACDLWLSNRSGTTLFRNATVSGVLNGTEINLTPSSIMADGIYLYNIECNDTFNRNVNISTTSLKLTIDTIAPTAPGIVSVFHQTNSTNKIPTLDWTTVTEANFSRYYARALYVTNNSIAYEINLTNKTLSETQLTLNPTYNYVFNVTVYDLAGNSNSSGNTSLEMLYYVDDVCGELQEGWNICGAIWTTPKNLSQIGAETGANMISVWNATHQFATCNYASSPSGQHCGVDVNIQSQSTQNGSFTGHLNASNWVFNDTVIHSVFVYVNETKDWNNRTWEANRFSGNITLTNFSGIGWNLASHYIREDHVFGDLKNKYGTNMSMMSLQYNNGSRVPYVNKGLFQSINNATVVEYGRAYWVHFNGSNSTKTPTIIANGTYDVGSW